MNRSTRICIQKKIRFCFDNMPDEYAKQVILRKATTTYATFRKIYEEYGKYAYSIAYAMFYQSVADMYNACVNHRWTPGNPADMSVRPDGTIYSVSIAQSNDIALEASELAHNEIELAHKSKFPKLI